MLNLKKNKKMERIMLARLDVTLESNIISENEYQHLAATIGLEKDKNFPQRHYPVHSIAENKAGNQQHFFRLHSEQSVVFFTQLIERKLIPENACINITPTAFHPDGGSLLADNLNTMFKTIGAMKFPIGDLYMSEWYFTDKHFCCIFDGISADTSVEFFFIDLNNNNVTRATIERLAKLIKESSAIKKYKIWPTKNDLSRDDLAILVNLLGNELSTVKDKLNEESNTCLCSTRRQPNAPEVLIVFDLRMHDRNKTYVPLMREIFPAKKESEKPAPSNVEPGSRSFHLS